MVDSNSEVSCLDIKNMSSRGGSRILPMGAHPPMQGGPGNVFTIVEMMYSGALCGQIKLRWVICEPP